jgi:hypothetical protein
VTTKTSEATWTISLAADTALERLRGRVSRPRILASAYGDLTASPGVVGVIERNRFDLRLQRFMASAGALHAFGHVETLPGGSRITVRFGRAAWTTWLRRGFIIYMLFLAAVGLVAALRQPVFLVGSGFIATIALVVLWSMRTRSEDVAVLRSFLDSTFADVQLAPQSGADA